MQPMPPQGDSRLHPNGQTISKRQVRVISLVSGLVIFLLLYIDDLVISLRPDFFLPLVLVDVGVGLLCGGLVLKLLQQLRRRSRDLALRLEMVGDMNHHIRNALEQIEMSASGTHDPKLIDNIQHASARIQWALREVLPREVKSE